MDNGRSLLEKIDKGEKISPEILYNIVYQSNGWSDRDSSITLLSTIYGSDLLTESTGRPGSNVRSEFEVDGRRFQLDWIAVFSDTTELDEFPNQPVEILD